MYPTIQDVVERPLSGIKKTYPTFGRARCNMGGDRSVFQRYTFQHQPYIDLLESVQRRINRIIHELRRLDYPRRLKMLTITTLETRNMRANLMEIINGLHSIYPHILPTSSVLVTENEHGKKEEGSLTG